MSLRALHIMNFTNMMPVFFGLGIVCILSFSTYIHLKQHVRIEKQIKKMFIQRMRARQLQHIHSKKPFYKQCHFLLGFNFLFENPPQKKEIFSKEGFFEKKLPDTISLEFEFQKPQDIQNLMSCIRILFKKHKKFRILENSVRHDSLIIVEEIHYPYGIKIQKRIRPVRVSLVPLACSLDTCLRYRLVCTWLAL